MSSNTSPPGSLMVQADPTKGVKVNAGKLAAPFRDEIKAKVAALKEQGIEAPLLVGLLANKDPAALQYAEWTGKACRNDGLRYELRILDDPIDVESALMEANDDPRVHGIIVYYPIFGQVESFSGASQDDYLRDSVSVQCDVEGLCHTYRTSLYRNVRYLDYPANTQKCLLPCTSLSVVKILEQCPGCYDSSRPVGKHLEGTVTILNRSEIVGRPLAAMLSNDGARVYSVDINSIYLFQPGGRLEQLKKADGNTEGTEETPESCVRKSSVVITGVPTKDYRLPTDWIQPNTTVVNVASFKNVDEEELLKIPGVVYVPMVGKMTVAMLERNLMRLFEQFHCQQYQYPARRTPTKGVKFGALAPAIRQKQNEDYDNKPWYGHPIHLYTAVTVTLLLAWEVVTRRK